MVDRGYWLKNFCIPAPFVCSVTGILYLRALIDALATNGTTANAAALNASFAELDKIYHVERNCCHPSSPKDCTDALDTQSNCTMGVLRPGEPPCHNTIHLSIQLNVKRVVHRIDTFRESSNDSSRIEERLESRSVLDVRVLYAGLKAPAAECSDRRLKYELQSLGVSATGVPLFSWRYRPGHGLDTSNRYRGTTAQALLAVGRADAVVADGCVVAGSAGGAEASFFAVDYSRLDVSFRPV